MTEPVHEIEVEIRNAEGLHMRPAMQFVDLAGQFKAGITVRNKDIVADAKSFMQMTMLAATYGTKLLIRAEGHDAREAVDVLGRFFEEHVSGDSGG